MKTIAWPSADPPPSALGMALRRAGQIVLKVLVVLLVFIELYPILWLLLSSVKAPDEFNLFPIYALPRGLYAENYVVAWTSGHMATYFKNSVLATFPSLLALIAISVPAAFGIEVLKWKLSNAVLLVFMAAIMVPLQIVLLPLFTMYSAVNLLDTRWGLILTYTTFGLPLTIFLMVGYFKAMPREMLEAAVVDGANVYQLFFYVALPTVMNSIVTITLVQFFFIWNDLVLSFTFVSDTDLRTLQTGLLNFQGQYGQRDWGPTFASIAMSILPTLLIYLLLNQFIIKGLTAGSVKG